MNKFIPDSGISWDELLTQDYNLNTVRYYDIEHEYSIHKSVTNELSDSIETYANIYYVDPFEQYKIEPNRYPYRIGKGIKHYLLWCSPKYNIYQSLAEQISQIKFPNCDLIVRKNHISTRTILTVTHYHIFVRKYF